MSARLASGALGRASMVGFTGVIATIAIACGGAVEVDRSTTVAEELKWGPGRIPGQIPSTGPVPSGCVRVEDQQIGDDITTTFSGVALTFTGWNKKAGARHEYVGFKFAATGPAAYAVKAGLETFYGTASSWTHPAGSDGHAIGNITFCPGSPTGGGTPGGGGSGGGGLPAGAACTGNGDCWSGECEALTGICSPGLAGTTCENGPRDCVSLMCTPQGKCAPNPTGARGDPCLDSAWCWEAGRCVLSGCTHGVPAYGCCEGVGADGGCRPDSIDCQSHLTCDPSSHRCA